MQLTETFLVGGWEKLELGDHTHLAIFALLFLVCVIEVILIKIIASTGLFTRPHHYDPDYDDSGEYEEDIYYENLQPTHDQWIRITAGVDYHHRPHEQEYQILQQQQHQRYYNVYDYSHDENSYSSNNFHTDVFRFVY